MGGRFLDRVGRSLADVLEKPSPGCQPFTPSALRATSKPGDSRVVEGDTRLSAVIKYLTQSTWSHAAMHVGPIAGCAPARTAPHLYTVQGSATSRK